MANNEAQSVAKVDLSAFKRPAEIKFPEDAPYSPQVATLGKMLFFDPRVSGAQNMSCATCHNPSFGWETPVDKAIGAKNVPLDRHAPTVLNLAEAEQFFWDGRAATLEEQAAGPITHPKEMAASFPELVKRLNTINGYRTWFERLYPGEGISKRTILTAIATFERTIQSGWTSFDEWVAGDETAISDKAKRGFELFVGKAQCVQCHTGWNFSDHELHDIGLMGDYMDPDTINAVLSDDFEGFKTPGLRNISIRAPYMHNGELASLSEVIDHYANGGFERASKSPVVSGFKVTEQEREDLISFLETLTEERPDIAAPSLPSE